MPWEVGGHQEHQEHLCPSLVPGENLKLFRFPTNTLFGLLFVFVLFCLLAPFLPRLTPWIVALAIVILALGFLAIGSIFFTWKLYKERSRERKKEFGSKGKSQCLEGLCVTASREGWIQACLSDFQQEEAGF